MMCVCVVFTPVLWHTSAGPSMGHAASAHGSVFAEQMYATTILSVRKDGVVVSGCSACCSWRCWR